MKRYAIFEKNSNGEKISIYKNIEERNEIFESYKPEYREKHKMEKIIVIGNIINEKL